MISLHPHNLAFLVGVFLQLQGVQSFPAGDVKTADTEPPNLLAMPLSRAEKNFPNINENSTILPVKSGGERGDFSAALVKCLPIVKYCALISIRPSICSLSCIWDQDKVFTKLVRILPRTIQGLCTSTNYYLDKGFDLLKTQGEDIRTLRQYVNGLSIDPDRLTSFAHLSVESLPMHLIKYGKGPAFDLLKPTVVAMQSAMTGSSAPVQGWFAGSNSRCKVTDLNSALMTLAETLTQSVELADITLPGYFTLSFLMTLPIDTLPEQISSVFGSLVMFAGLQCSAILYAYEGNRLEKCAGITGPTYPRYMMKRPKKDAVCDYAFNSDWVPMHPLFPGQVDEKGHKPDNSESIYDDGLESAPISSVDNTIYNDAKQDGQPDSKKKGGDGGGIEGGGEDTPKSQGKPLPKV